MKSASLYSADEIIGLLAMMLDIAAYVAYACILVYAAATDWRTLRIPNKLVIAIMLDWLAWQILRDLLLRFAPQLWQAAGSAGSAGSGGFGGNGDLDVLFAFEPLDASAAGGVLAAVVFGAGLTLFTLAYEAATHRYSMGGGDIKLMAASALFLGMQRSLLALMIACVAAMLTAPVYLHVRKRQRACSENAPCATFPSSASEVPDPACQGSTNIEAPHPEGSHSDVSRGFPFGPAIAIGSLAALLF